MFSQLVFGKKGEPVILEVFLDRSIYEKFRVYTVQNCLEESDAVARVLERGMVNYWLHIFKQMKTSYLQLKELLEEYKKDNELLSGLQRENERLKDILQKKLGGSEMKIRRKLPIDEGDQRRRNYLISALEAVERSKKVQLKVSIPYEVAERLRQFLKEKGILESQGIPLLIQYGLSEESGEELERLKNEMSVEAAQKLWGEYAVMRFKAYEYFMGNKALVMRLSSILQENGMLKRRLKTEGLEKLIPKNEWGGWNNSIVDTYYQKYVFGGSL